MGGLTNDWRKSKVIFLYRVLCIVHSENRSRVEIEGGPRHQKSP